MLLDRVDGGRVVGRVGRADVRRLAHVSPRQGDDLAGHRGREQHGLAGRGQHRYDPLDIGEEAHVEHFVGLVEHEDLHVPEDQMPLPSQVDQATGRTDDDLDAAGQGLDLRLVRPPAVHAEHARAELGAGLLEVLGDLQAQLAGGHDDQGLGGALAGVGQLVELGGAGRRDPLQQRDAEAERLAGAGLGLADQVAALEGLRDAQLLDLERVGDAGLGQRGGDGRDDAQISEGWQNSPR